MILGEVFGFVKEIVSPVTNLIDNLTTSNEEKLQLKNKLTEIENNLSVKILEHESAIVNAQKDVMIAELNQDDKYTKRARPTIVYAGLGIVFLNHLALPWIAFFTGCIIPKIELPAEFWYAWGGVTGVWAWGRTTEKKATITQKK